jgi:hypothetical protein
MLIWFSLARQVAFSPMHNTVNNSHCRYITKSSIFAVHIDSRRTPGARLAR